jgi:hypothetical protein
MQPVPNVEHAVVPTTRARYFHRHLFLSLLPLLIVAALASVPRMAHAQNVIGVHTLSRHQPHRDYQKEENYGLYYRTDEGIEVGGYRNTLDDTSLYVAQTWQWRWFSASLGLLSGYQKRNVQVPCTDGSNNYCWETRGNTRGAIGPLIAVSVTSPPLGGVSARLNVIPGFLVDSPSVFHLSLEHPL